DRGTRSIAAPPQPLGDYDVGRTSRLVISRNEGAAEHRLNTQRVEECGCHRQADDLLRIAIAYERVAVERDGIDGFDAARPRFPIEEIGNASWPAIHSLLLERIEDHH